MMGWIPPVGYEAEGWREISKIMPHTAGWERAQVTSWVKRDSKLGAPAGLVIVRDSKGEVIAWDYGMPYAHPTLESWLKYHAPEMARNHAISEWTYIPRLKPGTVVFGPRMVVGRLTGGAKVMMIGVEKFPEIYADFEERHPPPYIAERWVLVSPMKLRKVEERTLKEILPPL